MPSAICVPSLKSAQSRSFVSSNRIKSASKPSLIRPLFGSFHYGGGKTGLFMDGFFYCDKMSFQCKVGDRLDKAAVGSRMCRPLFLRADRVRSNHGVWTLVDGEHILFRQGKVTCHAGEIVFQKQVKIGIKSIFAEEVGIFLNCFSHSVRCFWRGGDQKICRLSLDRRKKRSEP